MAGDIEIDNRLTLEDFKNLDAVGVGVKLLLDLTHPEDVKEIHLDIDLDFSGLDEAKFAKFKQTYTRTYAKLRFGERAALKLRRKVYSTKYEAKAFGQRILSAARNKAAILKAIEEVKNGQPARGMIEVRY